MHKAIITGVADVFMTAAPGWLGDKLFEGNSSDVGGTKMTSQVPYGAIVWITVAVSLIEIADG
jgi:hypothetical protein